METHTIRAASCHSLLFDPAVSQKSVQRQTERVRHEAALHAALDHTGRERRVHRRRARTEHHQAARTLSAAGHHDRGVHSAVRTPDHLPKGQRFSHQFSPGERLQTVGSAVQPRISRDLQLYEPSETEALHLHLNTLRTIEGRQTVRRYFYRRSVCVLKN